MAKTSPDTNVPARSDRICHRQLVNFSTDVDSDCGCQENECSIYDDERNQCGEYTHMQVMYQLSKVLSKQSKLLDKELAAYRN